jgi:hypothetical protein
MKITSVIFRVLKAVAPMSAFPHLYRPADEKLNVLLCFRLHDVEPNKNKTTTKAII